MAKNNKSLTESKFYASIYPERVHRLPIVFVNLIKELEKILGMPVWFIIQNDDDSLYGEFNGQLFIDFLSNKNDLPPQKPVAFLIDSPGGNANFAYKIGRFLQDRTNNNLTVIIPYFAKSAATLFALAGKRIILGEDAELGPLDVQLLDVEREKYTSALDAIQSLERLSAFGLTLIDQTMRFVISRSGKRTDILLPQVFTYTSHFLRPLLEKIDAVDYTRMSRDLKIAEDYAIRLMKLNYGEKRATEIAATLVKKYPAHRFVIDKKEAADKEGLGLNLYEVKEQEKFQDILNQLLPFLTNLTVIGRIGEAKK
jgi:uncharacterized protein Veg